MTNFFYDLNAKLAAVAGKKQLNEADISRLSPDYVSDKSDMVRFEVYGDEAVDALNDMLGHVIDWDDEDMMVIPREYMPEVQEIVDELGGELVMNECGAAPGVTPEHLDELSKDTLKSYGKKAAAEINYGIRGKRGPAGEIVPHPNNMRHARNRKQGIERAFDRLEEAGSRTWVETRQYSWGPLKVIHKGHDFSIILHPELIDAICALSDGGHTVIRDETNTQYGVMRHGDQLHFKNPRAGVDVVVDRSEICDDEQIDELSKDTLGRYVQRASRDQYERGRAVGNKNTSDTDWSSSVRRAFKHDKGIERAVKRLTRDDEQLDELSKDTLKSYHNKAGKDADRSWGLANAAAQRSNKGRKSDMDQFMKHSERFGKRKAGMDRATSRLNEGTWSLPDSEEKVERLCKILSAPLAADGATHALYNYLGNDDLFDRLDNEAEYYGREDIPAERQDVRDLVIGWLKKNANQFPEYQAVLDKLGAEQVNELSKNTLGSYIKKATRDAISKADRAGMKVGFGHDGAADDYMKASKREQGIHRATDRLTESDEMEELISGLRKAYANVDRIDPASPMYKKLIAFLDSLDGEHLRVLADAGVKFVSMLAKSRLMRKGFDECSMNERAGPVGGGRWQSKMEEDEVSERAGPLNKKDWNGYYKSGKIHNDKTWGQQLHLGEGKKAKPDYLDVDKDGNKSEPMKQAIKQSKLKEADKPDYIDIDKDGNRTEKMRKAIKDKEQLDELSPDTLKSYGKKAAGEIKGKTMQHGRALDTYSKANSEKKAAALRPGVDNAARKLKNREKGVQQAFDRLEETDQINELSHDTMGNYLAKARREGGAFKTYDKKDSASDSKRDKGAKTAIKKMSKAPLDESESMNKDKIKAYVYDQIMKAINKSGKSNEELMKAVGFCKGCIKEWTKEAKKRG